jgi:hypothetical protein
MEIGVMEKEKEKTHHETDEAQSYSIFREFWDFLKNSKKWWLLPIVIILVLMSIFVVLSTSSTVFPMIYAIF